MVHVPPTSSDLHADVFRSRPRNPKRVRITVLHRVRIPVEYAVETPTNPIWLMTSCPSRIFRDTEAICSFLMIQSAIRREKRRAKKSVLIRTFLDSDPHSSTFLIHYTRPSTRTFDAAHHISPPRIRLPPQLDLSFFPGTLTGCSGGHEVPCT